MLDSVNPETAYLVLRQNVDCQGVNTSTRTPCQHIHLLRDPIDIAHQTEYAVTDRQVSSMQGRSVKVIRLATCQTPHSLKAH